MEEPVSLDYGSAGFPEVTDLSTPEMSTSAPLKGNILQPQGVVKYMYLISGSLGIVGNALVIVVIFNFTTLRKKLTNIFIIHQSFVDFCASLVLLVLTLTQKQHYVTGVAGDLLCRIWLSTHVLWVCFTVSTFNLCILTIERYVAIVHPIAHKTAFTYTKAAISMVLAWILGIINNLYHPLASGMRGDICFSMKFYPSLSVQRMTGVINFMVKFFIPIAIMIYSYGRILYVINQKIQPGNEQGQAKGKGKNSYSGAKKKTVRMLILVCLAFVLCWSWNQFYFLAYNLGANVSFQHPFFEFSIIAVFCNCCINPFIYIAKFEEFQRGLRIMLRLGKRGGDNLLMETTSTVASVRTGDTAAEDMTTGNRGVNPAD